jgi:hypothetical protein
MHQVQNISHQLLGRLKSTISTLQKHLQKSEFSKVGIGDWQSMHESSLSLRMN